MDVYKIKKYSYIFIIFLILSMSGCISNSSKTLEGSDTLSIKEEKILIACASSLKNCFDGELIPMFEEKHSNIKIDATYDSSGKLQEQIEEGADVDVFMSAAMKQMKALDEKKLMNKDSIISLVENKIVQIVPKDSDKGITSYEEILIADTIAVGDPDSVPAGQYAKESFENLGIWDQVSAKSSFGTNVTEVLNWVAEGSADAGVVYATDAASNEKVQIVAEAPEGSVSKVVYPVGIVKASKKVDSAKLFIEFLKSEEAMSVFEKYGFVAVE